MNNRIVAVIEGITPENKLEKFHKAIKTLSKEMDLPATIQKKHDHGTGEKFPFIAQEELVADYTLDRGLMMDDLYSRICATLNLPTHNTFSKSIEKEEVYYEEKFRKAVSADARSLLKRKLQFDPSTGQYLTTKDIDAVIDSIDNFLNRNTKGTAAELTIDSSSAAKILANMVKDGGYDKAKDKPLGGLSFQKKTFPVITADYNRYFGPDERRDLQERVVGAHITNINDNTQNAIRNIIVNGESAGKTNSEISQDLFDKFGSLNKDWQRIVDTETANMFDESYVAEQVSWTEPGERVYFKRIEFPGGNICDFCAQAISEDVIALYVDYPLGDDQIDDPVASVAIWSGKTNVSNKRADWVWPMGSVHPNCFSDDTEVLTDHGWKLFRNVLLTDRIMSIDPDSKNMDFVSHKGLISYRHEGEMIHFTGRNYDKLVTPDHNCLYKKRGPKLLQAKAKDLIGENVSLPRNIGIWGNGDDSLLNELSKKCNINPEVMVKLWGWFLSEGNVRAKNGRCEIKISQKYPLDVIKDIGKDVRFRVSKEAVYIYDKYIVGLFSPFDGVHAEQKYIPNWLRNVSVKYQKIFVNSFMLGDGTIRNKESCNKAYGTSIEKVIRTSSPLMMADLCEMIIKSGSFCSVNKLEQKGKAVKHKNGTYITKTDCYNLNITKSKYRHYHKEPVLSKVTGTYSKEILKIPYSGMVYDVELVKWHFLLVKRNGKLAWSGNCRGMWERYYPEDK